jgi:intracellular sulfur oxidation DsrE/DsrF family protein
MTRLNGLLLFFLIAVWAPYAAFGEAQPAAEGAFVEHRVALQISDAAPEKQTLVLNAAFNVLKVYGPDKVAIKVVAFGPGIDLLRDGNTNEPRIASLMAQGVQFEVCMNTVETVERTTGKHYPLNPVAHQVTAGVPELMSLAEHGYTLIRP